ncbi:MAG: HAMP domain-containing histidine kinase [Clostridiales bacterium]|nr:HAMP domain-containing histidine kinase [Clostridiales bacterium]
MNKKKKPRGEKSSEKRNMRAVFDKREKYGEIGKRMLMINVFAIMSAVLLFCFLFMIENKVIGDRFKAQEYVAENTIHEIGALQEFINEKQLTTKDIDEIDDWVYNRRNVMLIIYDEGKVIYDSTLGKGGQDGLEEENTKLISGENTPENFPHKYTLDFADKTVKIDFISFFDMRARFIYVTFQFCICFLLILIIVLFNVFKMANYYTTLEADARKIEEGDLNHNITVKGYGRLSSVASAMERMRVSIIERHEKENELIESSHNLVMSMSHDLRTPLTILIGYLEILSGKKYKDEETRDVYIDKCKEKAYQIKQLSDRLFEYFLAFSTNEEDLHTQIYDKNVFSELMEDYIFTLNENGFKLDYSKDSGKDYFIALDIQLMRRVMDNLFSNINKYADKDMSVNINVFNNGHQLIFSFSNYIRKNLAEVESTNIGLEVCKKIILRHKGNLDIFKEEGQFKVIIKLPVTRNRAELENEINRNSKKNKPK